MSLTIPPLASPLGLLDRESTLLEGITPNLPLWSLVEEVWLKGLGSGIPTSHFLFSVLSSGVSQKLPLAGKHI